MRILQISSARSIGGGERHVIDLSNELARRGHEAFAAVIPGSPLPKALSEIPPENILELQLRNALDVASAMQLARFVKEKRIDLMNAHFARDYPPTAAASRVSKVPYVLTRHVLFPMSRLHRAVLKGAKFVIAPSNAVADSLRAQSLFPVEKIVTIRYGLDAGRFPIVDRTERDGICVGTVGNLDPVKGLDIFIRAASIVRELHPETKFKIVGEDRSRDKRNEKDLKRLIADLGLDGSVELMGFAEDIASVLAGFDIFVSASRSESFGFVIAEAMLSGIPVIATETQGAQEIISDPALGVLIPLDSTKQLAEAILALMDVDSRRNALSILGREYIMREFSNQRMVSQTESLYRRSVREI